MIDHIICIVDIYMILILFLPPTGIAVGGVGSGTMVYTGVSLVPGLSVTSLAMVAVSGGPEWNHAPYAL